MDLFMLRCYELARIPGAAVEPNPRVGAVVVHDGRIVGEGWHRRFGEAHAEVNAIRSVKNKGLLSASTLYVSLEPCNHYGKTPPCTELILQHNIPRVVIGELDPNPKMAGHSVELLRQKGVQVEVLSPIGQTKINPHFETAIERKRPFVTLKWAESEDGFISKNGPDGNPQPYRISTPFVSRWVHWLRHNHQAILIGKNTASIDDPALSTRLWPGNSPIVIVLDKNLELSRHLRVFNSKQLILINSKKDGRNGNVHFFIPESSDSWATTLKDLANRFQIGSMLVEGGRNVLQQFIDQGCWDEIYRNQATDLSLRNGTQAPRLGATPFQVLSAETGQKVIHYRNSLPH